MAKTTRLRTVLAAAALGTTLALLRTSGVEQVEMMRRLERRIRPATEKVYARTLDRETCRVQYRKITVHVKPKDDTINATADIQGNVTFYGGLVRRVGSDDEITSVMGHEMAYVLKDAFPTRGKMDDEEDG